MSGSKFLSTLKKAATVAGDVLTTKGDILSRSSSALGRLAVGANDTVLTAASGEVLGVKWAVAASGGAKSFFVNSFDGHIGTTSQFQNIGGRAPQTDESIAQVYLPLGFTWSNLSTSASTFTANANPTIKSRDDGSTGNQVITITGTGQFEDVSNSDTVAANSLCNYISGGEPSSGSSVIVNLVSVCEI